MWQTEMTTIIRHIIDDLDPENYQFSDSRIREAILVAAQLIHNELEFSIQYIVNISDGTLSPDPTTTSVGEDSKDDDFIALCCLRAGLLFTGSQLKTYSLSSVMLKDGPSILDTRSTISGLRAIHEELVKKYEAVKLDYQTSKLGLGKAILSPYSPGSFAWNSSYYNTDGRAGIF